MIEVLEYSITHDTTKFRSIIKHVPLNCLCREKNETGAYTYFVILKNGRKDFNGLEEATKWVKTPLQ